MILNSPYVSGSLTVTGNITALGGISISGSIASASYAANAELLDGLDSSVFVLSSSFQNYSSSNDGKVAALNTFSASILSYTSSTDDKIAQLNRETASLNLATASINNATASLYAATASIYNFTSSANLRIGSLEQYTQSLNTRSASFACITATNNFGCAQYFSNASNAISFTSTGSLYSDGGMRITKDMYVSGTAFFNNVTVFGTQSINYITSSQLNIASNLITVNTSTPAVRFGGLAVYDSGSLGTGLTGSILWDSENNHWVYSNPSGSSYSGGMFISGPRSAALGSEQGTTACALMMGQGGDHITSSAIFHYGNATCFYGNSRIDSLGNSCQAGTICATNATFNGCVNIFTGNQIRLYNSAKNNWVQIESPLVGGDAAIDFKLTTQNGVLYINNTGVTCFNNAICAPRAELTSDASCVPLRLINGVITGGSTTGVTALYLGDAGSGVSMLQREKYAANQANLVLYSEYGYNIQSINACMGYNGVAFYTAGTKRLNIDGSGITCFASTVCSPGLDVMPSGIGVSTLGGIMRVVTAGTSVGIAVGQSNANRYTHIAANDIQVFNDDFFLSTRCAFPLSIGTCYTARLTFAATGVACFSCQVCIGNASTVTGNGLLKLGVAAGNAGAALQFLGWSPASGYKSWQIDTAYIGGDVLSFTPSTTGGGTTFTTPVLSIGSSGISCFSSTVCAKQYSATFAADGDNIATFINSASSYLYGAGGVFIGSSTAHNCTNLAGGSGALIIRNGASTYTAAIAYNGTAYFCGNVGIGISPSYKLDVCSGDAQTARFAKYCAGTGNTNGQIAEFVNLAAGGYSSYIYIGSSPGTDWKIGKNVTNCNVNYDFTIVDSSNFGRMRITPTGEVCFACQVCAASFIANGDFNIRNTSFSTTGTLNKVTWTNLYPSTYNVADIGVQLDGNYYNGSIIFRTADADNANVLVERMRMESRGVTCFRNTVCTPVLRASRVISNSTQLFDSDFSLNAGVTRSVVLCGGIYTMGDFHLMVYGNAGTGMSTIRLSTAGYFANSNLLQFCELQRYTFGSMTISSVSNNGTSISFNIGNCSVSNNGAGFWRMISLNGDAENNCIKVFVL